VLDTIQQDGLLANATRQGMAIAAGVRALGHPLVVDVRGAGLLLGVVLGRPVAKQVEAALRERGVLVNAVQPDVLRLAPALLLSDADVAELLDRLPAALDAVVADQGVPA
jgi:acetylornithine/N-succinyldiaminopimelate aminotransferase